MILYKSHIWIFFTFVKSFDVSSQDMSMEYFFFIDFTMILVFSCYAKTLFHCIFKLNFSYNFIKLSLLLQIDVQL